MRQRLRPFEGGAHKGIESVERLAQRAPERLGRTEAELDDRFSAPVDRGVLGLDQVVTAEEFLPPDRQGGENLGQGVERRLLAAVLDPRELTLADLRLRPESRQDLLLVLP